MHRDHARGATTMAMASKFQGIAALPISAPLRRPDLTHIKDVPALPDIVVYANSRKDCNVMSNVGSADRVVRFVVGLLLIAFAIPLGFPQTGWNWVGWIGVVPLLTAIFAYCPAYSVFGVSTCSAKQRS